MIVDLLLNCMKDSNTATLNYVFLKLKGVQGKVTIKKWVGCWFTIALRGRQQLIKASQKKYHFCGFL